MKADQNWQGGRDRLIGLEAAVYLRKSRMEEGMETAEVLSRHQKALTDYAAARHIHIAETYPEVVSGESLYARPQMLRLLQDVEEGRYEAVLCMDLDRLSRGKMRDQGMILDAFKSTGTLIVTPDKVYDLSDEIDEEYAELKTFISRREYKIITKRLRRGLQQSIQDGCYVANAPYGYHNVYVDRRPTLEIYEPEAKFVRLMFQLYAQGNGCVTIARQISALGARPHRSAEFNRSSVAKILNNPTYIGKIVWNQKKHIRKGEKGNEKHITIYQPKDQWTIVDGRHQAIIDTETWEKVQSILEQRYQPPRYDGTVKSPLAGLIKCANCGRNMQRMVMKKQPYLLCTRAGCCCSAQFPLVEARMISALEIHLQRLELLSNETDGPDLSVHLIAVEAAQKELAAAQRQKSRLYELLEMGEYDLPTFRERMDAVRDKISRLEAKQRDTAAALAQAQSVNADQAAQKLRSVLDAYASADIPGKNALLKSIVDVAWYRKEHKTKPNDFDLDVRLKSF